MFDAKLFREDLPASRALPDDLHQQPAETPLSVNARQLCELMGRIIRHRKASPCVSA
jgi:hypothetical protein